MLVRYILSNMCLRRSILSTTCYAIYGTVCFSFSCTFLMILRLFVLIIIVIKSETWIHSHCSGLGHETMVYVVYLAMFSLLWRHNERWHLKSPASWLYTQLFVQAQIKKNKKAPRVRHGPFVQGIQWWPVSSLHKGPVTQKMFSFDDVIMLCLIVAHGRRQDKLSDKLINHHNRYNLRMKLCRCCRQQLYYKWIRTLLITNYTWLTGYICSCILWSHDW